MTEKTNRRTKIVATFGPATSTEKVIREMILAGLNIARLNFSHGTPDEKKQTVELIRKIANEEDRIVGILADLQGPKIRIAKFKNEKIFLPDGAAFILDAEMSREDGDESAVGIDYKELPNDVKAGDTLLLDDGRLTFTVEKVEGPRVFCLVVSGGELSNKKGINRQGGGLTAPALTDKDKDDLKVAVDLKVDYIAISFPRCAADIEEAKELIKRAGGDQDVIAKIERLEAIVLETLDEIILASHGIMVARGDLAVEIGDAEVPAMQKHMIKRARDLDKPVITATQMLESMITSVTPTRAEVSDVANAVLDGTDAVMLSAETAKGEHPALVIKTMDRICRAAEKHPSTMTSTYRVEYCFVRVDEVVSMAAMYAASRMNAKAIICLTETGITPLWMSRIRSGIPIYGLSRHLNTLGKMALFSDVYPINFDVTKFDEKQVKLGAIAELKKRGYIAEGDFVIITYGDHIGLHGGTNSLSILRVDGV